MIPPGPPHAAPTDPRLRAMIEHLDQEVPPLLLQAGAPWATMAVRLNLQAAAWVWNAPPNPAPTAASTTAPAVAPRPAAPVTPRTVVRWASLAKPVTAMLVLRLQSLGRLRLDDPAVAHSPSFQPSPAQLAGHDAGSITIRHLLTHTSGMGVLRYPPMPWRRARPRAADLLRETTGPRAWSLQHAPGARITYGSAAYVWVQSIIEDLTGMEFEVAARRLLLRELGLARVALLGNGRAPRPIAWGVDDAGVPISRRRSTAPGATGLFGTPAEIAALFAGLIEGGRLHELLGADTVAHITTNQTPGLSEAWGLGWRLQESEDGPVFRHAGWPDGVLAYTEGLPRLALLTCFEIGRAGARRALVRMADIARWHARPVAGDAPR